MTARTERGTAVIMAMLIVAAAATLVSGAMWQQSALIRQTQNELEYAQARWLMRGAIDWAGVILREDARTSSVDHPGEPWAVPLADTRLNENDGRLPAYLAGGIEDEQGKFNLRNLVANGQIDPRELKTLGRLVASLGLNEAVAQRIAERMRSAVQSAAAPRPAAGARRGGGPRRRGGNERSGARAPAALCDRAARAYAGECEYRVRRSAGGAIPRLQRARCAARSERSRAGLLQGPRRRSRAPRRCRRDERARDAHGGRNALLLHRGQHRVRQRAVARPRAGQARRQPPRRRLAAGDRKRVV